MNRRPGPLATLDAPAFDACAADALAVLTLLVTGDPGDLELAGTLVDDLLGSPDGGRRLVHGLSSVSAGLVALLEFFGGLTPTESVQELGRLIAID